MMNKKYNYTFNITSDGETFNETNMFTEKGMLEMKERMEKVLIRVNRIYQYDLGGISSERKMIYSNKKGWI